MKDLNNLIIKYERKYIINKENNNKIRAYFNKKISLIYQKIKEKKFEEEFENGKKINKMAKKKSK